jgi:hypothetical protein
MLMMVVVMMMHNASAMHDIEQGFDGGIDDA